MNRRTFLATTAAASLLGEMASAARAAPSAAPVPVGWRTFEITTRVELPASQGPAVVWVPLAQNAGGYQSVLDVRWGGSGSAKVAHDALYGAATLHDVWTGGTDPRTIEVTQVVATRDRESPSLDALTEAERRFWTAGTADVPTDGIVKATAERIVAGQTTPRARLRALYDWVIDTTWRDPATPGCGLGDVKSMLESQKFGGKCADINGLMTALARAAGFPARDVYGVRVAESRLFPSLGRAGDISKAQHCRVEVYLDEAGWFPLDPADVRKVVLEQKLPLDSPQVAALRERLFGRWEMNWIGYNSATGIELPGATAGQRPSFAFLMYPCGFVGGTQLDALDPAKFRYEIRSREVSA
ncbi:MAG: transglutaminase-like domain-containing protein [Acetobacteraceae bacterium]